MEYKKVVKGIFKERPNRFIAFVDIDGEVHRCHVKNTGRCRELLTPDATVILEQSDNPSRKTMFDLVAVYKGDKLINMDSQAPNKVFYEWVKTTDYFGKLTKIRPETKYKNSRFDFYLETENKKIFVEVKGVTLENNGVVLFPDAPTERGFKHVYELIDAKRNGYDSYIFFVVQMQDVLYFTPNKVTHKAFADGLKEAERNGVKIVAMDSVVTEKGLSLSKFVDIKL